MAKKEEICSFTFLTATKHQYSKRLWAQRQSLPLQLKMFTAAGGEVSAREQGCGLPPKYLHQQYFGSPYQRVTLPVATTADPSRV